MEISIILAISTSLLAFFFLVLMIFSFISSNSSKRTRKVSVDLAKIKAQIDSDSLIQSQKRKKLFSGNA